MDEPTQSQDDELAGELEKGSPLVARIGLFLGPALAAIALIAAPSLGLTRDSGWVFAMLALMACWWVTLAVEPAVTGLVPFIGLAALGIGKPAEIASPYANDVMFLFAGGSLLAFALERTGVSAYFAMGLVRLAGTSPLRILAAVMLASALMSAFVSNLATAATMLPLSIALGTRARQAAVTPEARAAATRFTASLLLGIAFASSIGGALTIVGSPPNPIAVEWLEKNGVGMDFVRWLRFSVPTTAVFLPIAIAVLGLWFFPARGITVPRADEQPLRVSRDGWVTLAVFLSAVAAWVFLDMPSVKDGTVAVAAALVLFLLPSSERSGRGILDASSFAKIPWRVLVLFGGGLCLADAMQRTGLSASLGSIIQSAGTLPPVVLLTVLVALLVFSSEVASNTALAAMAVPIVGALAPGLGMKPEALVIPAVFAASWAFALPVGTPPNALVFASGRVRSQDMMRAGLVLDLIAIVVIVTMATILL
ncbi:MAG: hypothetical protein RLZZ116_425 [Planctomycetota bacterium]|jgi:sodium-dependent dicarboxylate transporter 2/3/5